MNHLNIPFEISRTRWNSSLYYSNKNDNGKISKEVPTKFKIHRTYYKGGLTQFWKLFTVIPCAPKDRYRVPTGQGKSGKP